MTTATTLVTIASLALFAGACGSSSKSSDAADTTTSSTAPAARHRSRSPPATTRSQACRQRSTAGIQDVTFVNKGQVDHEMAFLKVKPGTTPKAAFDALTKVFEGNPFPDILPGGEWCSHHHAPARPPRAQFNLTAGDYIALCSESGDAATKKDGKPHFARGMYKTLKVTGTGGDERPDGRRDASPPTTTASS